MDITEENKQKIRTMFNVRYINGLVAPLFKKIMTGADYDSTAIDYDPDEREIRNAEWKEWVQKHGILKSKDANIKNYVRIEGIADDKTDVCNNEGFPNESPNYYHLPENFVEKVLVLGFLPD